MIFKCDCCGHMVDLPDGEAAFDAGWDAPPHFFGYVACTLCPASNQFLEGGWGRHASVHEQWTENGRPAEYSQETCVAPEDRVPQETLDRLKDVLDGPGDMPDKIRALFKLKEEGLL